MRWYRADVGLSRHRKTAQFSQELECSLVEAIGLLHLFWEHVAEQYETGNITDMNDVELSRVFMNFRPPARIREAFRTCNFIDSRPSRGKDASRTRIVVHGWNERNAKVLRDRARKRTARASSADSPPYQPYLPTLPTEPTLPTNQTDEVLPSGGVDSNGVSSGSLFGEDGSRIDWQAIIVRWNDLAKAHDRPKLFSMNETRRKHYKARLRATPNFWEILEREIPKLGEHAQSAKNYCTFPWLISSQEKLDKLAEGNYRADEQVEPTKRDQFSEWQKRRAEERERKQKGASDGS